TAAHAALATASAGRLGRPRGGSGTAERTRWLQLVLLRMRPPGASHRGEGAAPGQGPAAALRRVLCRPEGAHLQELRRAPSRQEAAGGMGEALIPGRGFYRSPIPAESGRTPRLMTERIITEADLDAAIAALIKADKRFGPAFALAGRPPLRKRAD